VVLTTQFEMFVINVLGTDSKISKWPDQFARDYFPFMCNNCSQVRDRFVFYIHLIQTFRNVVMEKT